MFIITGSRIKHAISSPRSSSNVDSSSRSLNGTTCVYSAMTAGMPLDIGVVAGASRPPTRSEFGTTENITASWCPWYEPSIFTMCSRPVAARAMRIALIVASVPELQNRTDSARKRRHSSSAKRMVDSVGAAKCVPVRAARSIASATFGCAWPTTMEPNPLWKSRYSLPSTSTTPLPWPSRRYTGYGSHAWNDEPTPIGMRRTARSYSAFDPVVRLQSRSFSSAAISRARVVNASSVIPEPLVLDHHVLELGVGLDRVDRHVLAVARLLEPAVRDRKS